MQEGPLFKSQLSYVADLATAIGSVSNSEFRGLCKLHCRRIRGNMWLLEVVTDYKSIGFCIINSRFTFFPGYTSLEIRGVH